MRLLIIAFFIPFIGHTQTLERHDTLPKIKSYMYNSFKVKKSGDVIKKLESGWYLYFMDDHYEEFDEDGELYMTIDFDYEYDVSITYFENYPNNELKSITDFIINEEGDTILDYYTRYYYDKKDFCYLDSSFNGDHSLNLISHYAKDYDQNVEIDKTVYPDGRVLSYYVSYYDDNDRLIKSESRDENNRVEYYTEYKRDTINNTTEYWSVDHVDTTTHSFSQYNEKGLEVYEINLFTNDSPNKKEHRFEYEYNKFGDWVVQYIYEDGKLEYMVERTIVYFD